MTEPQSDREVLLEIQANTNAMYKELLGGNGREGRVPKVERLMEEHSDEDNKRFNSIDKKLSFAQGAFYLLGFLLTVFGAMLVEHMLVHH